jgi:hypothetical protein
MSSGVAAAIAGSAIRAASRPTAAPAIDSAKASTSNCAIRCRGDAPSAVRTAISRWRESARVRRSDATLSVAISISSPTAPKSTMSAGR